MNVLLYLLVTLIKNKNNIKILILKKNLCEIYPNEITIATAYSNDLSLLKYSCKNNCQINMDTICAAVKNDNFGIVSYLFEMGYVKEIHDRFVQNITNIFNERYA